MSAFDLLGGIEDPGGLAWMEGAGCRGIDLDIFYPEDRSDNAEAKAICATCCVRDACLEHAIVHNELGIWGGRSESERRRIRRQRRQRHPLSPSSSMT
ncbi:MAG: WhiB family transcriptional regulator [Acidimicrobiales bacterium]